MNENENVIDTTATEAPEEATPQEPIMVTSDNFLALARDIVANYTNQHMDRTDGNPGISARDVYVVWMCKTLQNFKALLSTPIPDGMYYEVTYDGDKSALYFDAYKKWENAALPVSRRPEEPTEKPEEEPNEQ